MLAVTPCILLAAGASNRLGKPKQLIEFGGSTLLAHAIREARSSGADPLFVVLGAHRNRILASTRELDACTVIENTAWREGMGSSLRSGVAAVLGTFQASGHAPGQVPGKVTGVLVMACDQPAVSGEFLREMLARHAQQPTAIIAAAYAGRLGIPALFPSRCFPELERLHGDEGARHLLRSAQEQVMAVPLAEGAWDIDTGQDLARLVSRGAGEAGLSAAVLNATTSKQRS